MGRFRHRKRKVVVKPNVKNQQLPTVDHVTGKKIPQSFVFSRTKLPSVLRQLEMDLRKLMLPYTALKLKEKKRNSLKDFLNVAGPMGVTHFLILSKTHSGPFLRVAKTPQGPTLTFKIHEYSLAIDVARAQLRPRCPQDLFKNSPLVKLSLCQRIVLIHYNKDTKRIDFRHYSIRLQPVGVSRRLRKFVQNHQVPDLRNLQDVSDFVTRAGYGSESEVEDEAAHVNLVRDLGRVNRASTKSAVKLQEIGPRMTLELVKIEDGMCSGQLLFSSDGNVGNKSSPEDENDEEEDEDEDEEEDEEEEEYGEEEEDGQEDEEGDEEEE
ncbi:peter Pan-like protein isoform X2 [Chenopodium quinoa]|uniref:peter Pan-like protein isoform X2 n=1 Tax=Chenopodium quinoa TaxID=63459 RepID=UPI000B776742|nr:peter Pan-like protein isoform X2 [Chenopodium quinoa]